MICDPLITKQMQPFSFPLPNFQRPSPTFSSPIFLKPPPFLDFLSLRCLSVVSIQIKSHGIWLSKSLKSGAGMRIQCDVCEKGEASVYCVADEAALCNSCDHRVHHANKLASKHQRFSLIQPPPKQAPLCDICQVFCSEISLLDSSSDQQSSFNDEWSFF